MEEGGRPGRDADGEAKAGVAARPTRLSRSLKTRYHLLQVGGRT